MPIRRTRIAPLSRVRTLLPALVAGLVLLLAVGLAACSGGPNRPVHHEVARGDRQRDWAMAYYRSWSRAGEPHYLRMAHEEMAGAVRTYFLIQHKIGHSYPTFYTIDRKRRAGCAMLRQFDRAAARSGISLSGGATGCL